MSRLREAFDDLEDEDIEAFERETEAAYLTAIPNLRPFLAYLDAMPLKEIIADRYFAPGTGRMCSIAAYCASNGASRDDLRAIEADSRLQRLESLANEEGGSEENSGWDGPTVLSGVRYGLPDHVAHDLAWNNDMVWDRIADGVKEIPGVRGRLADGDSTEKVNWWARLVPDENGRYWIQQPVQQTIYRDMTPAERWLRLRNYVANKVGEPTITVAQ